MLKLSQSPIGKWAISLGRYILVFVFGYLASDLAKHGERSKVIIVGALIKEKSIGIGKFAGEYTGELLLSLSTLLILSVLIHYLRELKLASVRLSKTAERLSRTSATLWDGVSELLGPETDLSETRRRLSGVLDNVLPWAMIRKARCKFRSGNRSYIERDIADFWISKYLVTNSQYKVFIDRTGHDPPSHWDSQWRIYPRKKGCYPVVGISLQDAECYCDWLGELISASCRLPSEDEWEYAARGINEKNYPWKRQRIDPRKANFAKYRIKGTTPVGYYEDGKSPFSCYDIVGNVSEWTKSKESERAIIRGSSYRDKGKESNCQYRDTVDPISRADYIGFRIVKEID